ncbi:MAG: DegV family protein [Oscillospiraceae bacterium]
MKVKVTADSTCDLSPELLARYDVTLAPLTVIKDGQAFADGVTITPRDIFMHVAAGGSLCSTAAVSVGEYQALFSRYAGSCDGLVHITIGGEFSTCYQNACLAAAEFPYVRVVDSRNLSTGQGHVVLEACRLGERCTSLDQLCRELEELTGRVEASFFAEPAGLHGQGRTLLRRDGSGGQS